MDLKNSLSSQEPLKSLCTIQSNLQFQLGAKGAGSLCYVQAASQETLHISGNSQCHLQAFSLGEEDAIK